MNSESYVLSTPSTRTYGEHPTSPGAHGHSAPPPTLALPNNTHIHRTTQNLPAKWPASKPQRSLSAQTPAAGGPLGGSAPSHTRTRSPIPRIDWPCQWPHVTIFDTHGLEPSPTAHISQKPYDNRAQITLGQRKKSPTPLLSGQAAKTHANAPLPLGQIAHLPSVRAGGAVLVYSKHIILLHHPDIPGTRQWNVLRVLSGCQCRRRCVRAVAFRISGNKSRWSVDVGVARVRVCTCTFTRGPCCLAHDSPIFGLGFERLHNEYTHHDTR